MEKMIEDLKNKALEHKNDLKRSGITIDIGGEEQQFRLSGIGEKAIKIEKFIKYEDIVEVSELGNPEALENIIRETIENYEPEK
jgi:hypothetical protein